MTYSKDSGGSEPRHLHPLSPTPGGEGEEEEEEEED